MFWHNFLQVGEQYVFLKLKKTTMNKVIKRKIKMVEDLSTAHSPQQFDEGFSGSYNINFAVSCKTTMDFCLLCCKILNIL